MERLGASLSKEENGVGEGVFSKVNISDVLLIRRERRKTSSYQDLKLFSQC